MKISEYIQYDALALAALVRNGEVTRRDLTDCANAIRELVDPQINAFVEAFDEIDELTDVASASFSGVPFAIKDIVCHIGGQLNEMGSRLAVGVRPEHDTTLMQAFRNAGLATIGRTTTPEFGFNTTTESVLTGPTCNPWDTARMTGGSSGGAAAAVAVGILPIAHANDGGGSIRIPASCCGLVGLKPSRGRVSAGPDASEGLNGMGVEFALSRTVRDSAALLDAVHGSTIGDPYIFAPPAESYRRMIEGRPRKLRIAYTEDTWSGMPVDDEVKKALQDTVALCESLGHEVCDATPQFDYDVFFECQTTLWTANLASSCTVLSELTGRALNLDTLEAGTLACYEHGMGLSVNDVYSALGGMNQTTRAVARFFTDYDVLLTPTVTKVPQLLGTYDQNAPVDSGLDWLRQVFSFAAFTALFNVTGQPAISLPLQRTSNNLPMGMQFVAPLGEEGRLLVLARELEQATPWPQIAPLLGNLLNGNPA